MEILTIPKIIQTFDANTTLKVRCLLSDYSEIIIEGKVSDVAADTFMMPGIVQATIKPVDAPEHRPFVVSADFNALPSDAVYQKLVDLPKNAVVKIRGTIEYVTPTILSLKNSEIIENEN